ncbi:F-box/kelch-repeat protein-like protein [Tanacetum coccineum]
MDLLQYLPYDVALQCLIRVPFNQFRSLRSVCKSWKDEIELPELLALRKSAGKAQSLVVMSQARVDMSGNQKGLVTPVYRLVVLDPETGFWWEMPPLPGFENGLPLFCEMGCLWWRRGANMPGGARSFFGCASDGDHTLFVAGGHDLEKNALKSAWMYDVALDKWGQLPDMTKERDECRGLFHHGKFHVLNGYPTNMQGHFHKNIEAFDMSTSQWYETKDEFLETKHFPNICVEGTDKKMYMCRDDNVVTLEDDTWQFVAKLPADAAKAPYMIPFLGHMLLLGASKDNKPSNAYKMDYERVWTKVEVPVEYWGHVQSGCCLII